MIEERVGEGSIIDLIVCLFVCLFVDGGGEEIETEKEK